MIRVFHPESGASRRTPFEPATGRDWAIARYDMPSDWRYRGANGRVLKFSSWEAAESKCIKLEKARNDGK